MKIQLKTYELLFNNPFKLAHGTRTGSHTLFMSVEKDGHIGYAEATFPPYLTETAEATREAIQKTDLSVFNLPYSDTKIISTLLSNLTLSAFTRALISNCLLDLNAQLLNISLGESLKTPSSSNVYRSSFTFTKNDLHSLASKKNIAENFTHIKLKLDGVNDIDFVKQVISVIHKPFCVDVNQGWEQLDFKEVIDLSKELRQYGCELIEQPFLKTNYEQHKQLLLEGILPVYADESIQNLSDLENHHDSFNGINIKVLKCGGIDNAITLAKRAKELNKKIIVGCMSESSCGCATAYTLNAFADYLDIDGPWLINNDPFTGFTIKDGKFKVHSQKGIGVKPMPDLF